MIFVTVGTQLPFDRLVGAVNAWALHHPNQTVVAQTGIGRCDFTGLTCRPVLDQTTFRETLDAADIVVAHAGMGSILLAAETGKPIVIMPRRALLGEHRNDHQSDTARKMAALPNVHVAEDDAGVAAALSALVGADPAAQAFGSAIAQPQLLAALRDFIWAGARPSARAPALVHQVNP